jgi:parallel beta-helix repeat protein
MPIDTEMLRKRVFLFTFLALSAVLVNIPLASASGSIYIRADGSIDPLAAPLLRSGDIYTFTSDISGSLIVQKDDIIINGASHFLQGTGSEVGIDLSGRTNVTVSSVNLKTFDYAIYLSSSHHITISRNNITDSSDGIWISDSSSNNIRGNNITTNQYEGIYLLDSSNNSVSGNDITTNIGDGVYLLSSSNNTISGNNINSNGFDGIASYYSSGNRIFHNSFISNFEQAYSESSTDSWDNGYPSSGNYWNDYTGVDHFSGPYQNITGSDTIGDTPYIIDANNQDRYPFMNPVPQIMEIDGRVGITGYKLLFKETISNYLSSPATTDYYWNFTLDKWDGTHWVSMGISDSTVPVVNYVIPALITVELPYGVYLISPSAVSWGNWLKVSYDFHWTFSNTNYSASYSIKLHVHQGDIGGAAMTFPYLGADRIVNLLDLNPISFNWNKPVSWTDTINPLDTLHRADINRDGIINLLDLNLISFNWNKMWTNAPPLG